MMMKRLFLIIVATIALLTGGIASASGISDAIYYGVIRASNTGDLAQNVSTNCSINSTSWMATGLLNNSATDVAIINSTGEDAPFMPGYDDAPWIVWYDSVPENGNIDAFLYTNASNVTICYFPTDEGMTVTDNETLKLGNNFAIEQYGFWDTTYGVNKSGAYKEGACRFHYVSATGNITSRISVSASDTLQYSNDSEELTDSGSYMKLKEITLTDIVENARIKFDLKINIPATAYGRIYKNDVAIGTERSTGSTTYVTFSEDIALSAISGDKIQIYAKASQYDTYVSNFRIYFDPGVGVTAPLSTGNHTVKTETVAYLSFDGNDTITIPDDSSLQTTNWTIAGWIKIADPSSSNQHIFDKKASSYTSTTGYMVYFFSNTMFLNIGIGTTYKEAGKAYTSTNWTHIAVGVSGNDFFWYYDAVSQGTTAFTGTPATGTQNLTIGKETTGEMYDIHLYNRALSPSEITDDYNGSPSQTGLVGYWAMDEGIGTTAYDTSGEGNNGTISGATWLTDGYIRLVIDGVKYPISTTAANVTDNSNNWTFCQNGVMPYMEYTKVTINGTPAGYWAWEYGETFTDQSVNNNTATPHFRTTSSNDNVTASLISFTPIIQAQASEVSANATTMMGDVPDIPETAFTEEEHPGFFFEPLVDTVWGITDLPASIFWYNFAFIIIIGAGIASFYLLASKGNISALLLKCIIMAVLMAFFALPGPNIYGFYVVIYFAFWCFGILVLSKTYGW